MDLSNYTHSFSLKNKLFRLLWNVVYSLLFRPLNMGGPFKLWRVCLLKLYGAQIDWTTNVYATVKIWAPWNLKMGAHSCLGPYVDCYNQGQITIGENSVISQKSYLCASSHSIKDVNFDLVLKPITIEDQVWVAAGTFVGPGVCIGEGAVVGARSAVFKNVEPWTVIGGNPAKFLKNRKLNSNE